MILQVGRSRKVSVELRSCWQRLVGWRERPFFEVLLDPIAKGLNYRRIFSLCSIPILGRSITSGYRKSAEVQTLNPARASHEQGRKINFVGWSFRRAST